MMVHIIDEQFHTHMAGVARDNFLAILDQRKQIHLPCDCMVLYPVDQQLLDAVEQLPEMVGFDRNHKAVILNYLRWKMDSNVLLAKYDGWLDPVKLKFSSKFLGLLNDGIQPRQAYKIAVSEFRQEVMDSIDQEIASTYAYAGGQ